MKGITLLTIAAVMTALFSCQPEPALVESSTYESDSAVKDTTVVVTSGTSTTVTTYSGTDFYSVVFSDSSIVVTYRPQLLEPVLDTNGDPTGALEWKGKYDKQNYTVTTYSIDTQSKLNPYTVNTATDRTYAPVLKSTTVFTSTFVDPDVNTVTTTTSHLKASETRSPEFKFEYSKSRGMILKTTIDGAERTLYQK